MKKKTICLLLVFSILMMSFTACSFFSQDNEDESSEPEETGQVDGGEEETPAPPPSEKVQQYEQLQEDAYKIIESIDGSDLDSIRDSAAGVADEAARVLEEISDNIDQNGDDRIQCVFVKTNNVVYNLAIDQLLKQGLNEVPNTEYLGSESSAQKAIDAYGDTMELVVVFGSEAEQEVTKVLQDNGMQSDERYVMVFDVSRVSALQSLL